MCGMGGEHGSQFQFWNFRYEGVEPADVMSNTAVSYSGSEIVITVDFDLAALPDSYNASAYQLDPMTGQGADNILPVDISVQETAPDSGIFTFTLTLTNANVDNYMFDLYISNFGLVNLGEYGRGISILSTDNAGGGSYGGGDLITFSTSSHDGVLPSYMIVAFEINGVDVCPNFWETDTNPGKFCQLEPKGSNELTVRTPYAFGTTGGDEAIIKFFKPSGLALEPDNRIQCDNIDDCKYTYDIMKTVVVTAISDSSNANDAVFHCQNFFRWRNYFQKVPT